MFLDFRFKGSMLIGSLFLEAPCFNYAREFRLKYRLWSLVIAIANSFSNSEAMPHVPIRILSYTSILGATFLSAGLPQRNACTAAPLI